MVTETILTKALEDLGIEKGDSVLVHSSFKSLGQVDGGAQTVVNAFFNAVGEEGTVVFPTLCQEDWPHVYENWSLDAPSDVGYLTNYFRKLPGALRSDQATHSVAAMGKDAKYITETHGISGLRYGMYGSTPFAADSPWEKMYHMNTKVVFIGVELTKCTFRHYVEYCFIEDCLKLNEGKEQYDALKSALWCYERFDEEGVWPSINNLYVHEVLEQENKIKSIHCGDAKLLMVCAKDFVDKAYMLIRTKDMNVFRSKGEYLKRNMAWLDACGIYKQA